MGLSERIDIILYRTVLNGPELRWSVSLALRQIWSVYVCDGLGFCLRVTFLSPHFTFLRSVPADHECNLSIV